MPESLQYIYCNALADSGITTKFSSSVLKTPHHRSPEDVGLYQVFHPLKHSHTVAMPATRIIVLDNDICTAGSFASLYLVFHFCRRGKFDHRGLNNFLCWI